jgi:HK97 family phage portal protein
LKVELETAHAGSENAGRPLLLEGGLDWKPMSLSPAEMDFREARNAAAREISLALGVPPQLLGIPGDNTYANYKEANLAFWRMTIIPLVQRTAGALGIWLGDAFEEAVNIRCNLDAVPALSEEREQLWARLDAASFLSESEKRKMAGLPPMPEVMP